MSTEPPVDVLHQSARVPLPRAGSPAIEAMRRAGFDVVEELGRGAHSIVYRVRRLPPRLARAVAIRPSALGADAAPIGAARASMGG